MSATRVQVAKGWPVKSSAANAHRDHVGLSCAVAPPPRQAVHPCWAWCNAATRQTRTRQPRKSQIPPDFVVKSQAIDIMDVIRSRIRRQNVVQTLSSNRLSRYKPLSVSEASWFTTKSVGVWDHPLL